MASLVFESRPSLSRPVLVAAFRGWNDGGNAASIAAGFLNSSLEGQRFAVIDPDDYVDFQQTRPRVTLEDGDQRELHWPETEFSHAALPDGRGDIVICAGVEPNLRWRGYCRDVLDVARATNAEMVVTLGGLLADAPHSRPVGVTGAAYDAAVIQRLGLQRSRYEGPTGIVGCLHDACVRAGIPSVSLWAAVPHYIGANPNPSAALALLHALERLLAVDLDPEELERASAEFDRQVASYVEADPEIAAYVRELERRTEEEDGEGVTGNPIEGPARTMPTGDELAAELQRFLREQREQRPATEDADVEAEDDDADDEAHGG